MEARPRKLLDQVRDAVRLKHYSYRTEQSYVGWIRRYILFYGKKHPQEMGYAEVEAFLTSLAVEGNVSASTQNQALSALLFLYRHVLHKEFEQPLNAVRAKRSRYLPTVLSRDEVRATLGQVSGVHGLVLKVLYGSGLRLREGLSLFCNSPARRWLRHPHRARTAGPQGCEDDHDLYPCAQSGWTRGAESVR
jgi:site-specific recombinase XerD